MTTADWLLVVTLIFACMQIHRIDLLIRAYTRRTYRPRHHQVTSRYIEMLKAQSRYESIFAEGVDQCNWMRAA